MYNCVMNNIHRNRLVFSEIRFSAGLLELLVVVIVSLLFCTASFAVPDVADVRATDVSKNKNLRILTDRKSIRAYEPIYVCLMAEQFATDEDAEIKVQRESETPIVVSFKKEDWVKMSVVVSGKKLERRGIILQASSINSNRTMLFDKVGNYKIYIKIGPDMIPYDLTVTTEEPGDKVAWETLGTKVDEVLQNNFPDPADQSTIDACIRIIRAYPKSMCAAYCQSYLHISKFKQQWNTYGRSPKGGGQKAYSDVASDLAKIAEVFQEGFFGEMTGFYAGYALGLAGSFDKVLVITASVKTRLTLWGDAVTDMHREVASHVMPKPTLIDPSHPSPTTAPTVADPAKRP